MHRPSLPLRLALVAFLAGLVSLGAAAIVDGQPPASLLADHPGFGVDSAADEAIFDVEERARGALIAACMQAQGFDWQARPASRAVTAERPVDLDPVDPNRATFENLAPERQAAWNRAMYGAADPDRLWLDADGDGLLSLEESWGVGCLGDAHRAIPGVYAARAALTPALRELRAAIRVDERVAHAEAAWADCAAGHGLRGRSRTVVLDVVEADLAAGDLGALGRLDAARRACDPAWEQAFWTATVEYEAAFVAQYADVLG